MVLNKRKFVYNTIYIFFVIVSIIFININSLNDDSALMIYAWLSNLTFIIGVLIIYQTKKNIMDFNIIFLLFMFLFMNGQVFLFSFGVDDTSLGIFRNSQLTEIIKAEKYFLFSFQAFILGVIFSLKNTKYEISYCDISIEKKYIKSIKITALFMLFFSCIPYLTSLLSKFILSVNFGYGSLYTMGNSSLLNNGIVAFISKMFIPGLFLYMFSNKEKKRYVTIISGMIITISLMNLIIGTRGDGLSLLVIYLVFRNEFIIKYQKKNMIKLMIIVVLIVVLIPIFSSFRSVENKNISSLMQIIETILDSDTNPVVNAVSEMGYTMHAWILTDRIIPEYQLYAYGESYFASFMMIIPSVFFGGYSFAKKAALDIWLQNTLNMSYGPGFSLFAETYYNFGWTGGIIFAFVLGKFFSYIFNIESKDRNLNIIRHIFAMLFLYNSLIIARFPFHNTIRILVYLVIFPYILITLSTKKSSETKKTIPLENANSSKF